MSSTTREKLIEVARQLFDRKGLENTTMSDIANASDKGRRTIYTYFKNKREIYSAVIERESESLLSTVRHAVEEAGSSPIKRLEAFIDARVRLIARECVRHRGTAVYKVLFMREIRRWERVRQIVMQKESLLLSEILDDGICERIFDRHVSERLECVLQVIFQGIEVKWLHECNDMNDSDMDAISDHVKEIVLSALHA